MCILLPVVSLRLCQISEGNSFIYLLKSINFEHDLWQMCLIICSDGFFRLNMTFWYSMLKEDSLNKAIEKINHRSYFYFKKGKLYRNEVVFAIDHHYTQLWWYSIFCRNVLNFFVSTGLHGERGHVLGGWPNKRESLLVSRSLSRCNHIAVTCQNKRSRLSIISWQTFVKWTFRFVTIKSFLVYNFLFIGGLVFGGNQSDTKMKYKVTLNFLILGPWNLILRTLKQNGLQWQIWL